MRRCRESDHSERAKMMGAEAGLEAAGKRLIGEQRIEVHRCLGHADALRTGRDGRVQVGQRVAVVEPGHLGHEPLDQLQDAIGPIDKAAQQLPRIDARLRAALVEPALDAGGVLGGREPDEGQEVTALEMRASLFEGVLALEINQR